MWSTASELWREWERGGVLRPQDYDSDVAAYVQRHLLGSEGLGADSIADALERARWTARDLIHALAPLVSSFAGMQRDLLRLLERVGAVSGTGDSIRVAYEFVEGEIIDDSLAAFRERVRVIERTVIHLRPWIFNGARAWDFPLGDHRSSEPVERLLAAWGAEAGEGWRFDIKVPDVPHTGNARVDERAHRVVSLVRYTLSRLESIGANSREMLDWLYGGAEGDSDPELREIAQAATDFWPLTVASAVHGWAAAVRRGAAKVSSETLDAIDSWLAGLESDEIKKVTIEQAVEDLADVLSLPAWGKRHELYSAWIATQIDLALESRLVFVVTDGTLRFPFRPTLLAQLDPPFGDIELWCEVRSPGVGALGGGRRAGVQPDYRFQRHSDGGTVAAVEVKQYKAPAAGRHSVTLRDYVRSLPAATVFLVAHGPIGGGAIDLVPVVDRHRARLHPDVRFGRPRESGLFRRDLAALFPPPPSRPTRIDLRWSARVHDLDLHVSADDAETSWRTPATRHSALRVDRFDGGPEIVDLVPNAEGSLEVEVHVYSPGALCDADPVVLFMRDDDVILGLKPTARLLGPGERWWSVAHIDDAGNVTPSPDSILTCGSDGPR